LLLAAVFLLAGIAKVGDPSGFAAAVRAFHLLPDPLVVPFALVLPWLEILAGLYLVAGFLTRMAAVAVAAMLVMFIVALLDALLTGNTAHPCGCFGSTSNPVVTALAGGDTVGWWDVIRDVILIGFSAALLSLGPGAYSIDAWLARLRGEVNGR
jgi:uncharacterized membrane protein YphA (DoxX/SURF4 family)